MKRVGVMGLAYCISAFMDCTIAASRGLGKTVVPTVIVILGSCVFRVIWVYTIFAHFHTIPSLYLLYPCSWTLTALAEIVYFVHCYKQAMKIFREPSLRRCKSFRHKKRQMPFDAASAFFVVRYTLLLPPAPAYSPRSCGPAERAYPDHRGTCSGTGCSAGSPRSSSSWPGLPGSDGPPQATGAGAGLMRAQSLISMPTGQGIQ